MEEASWTPIAVKGPSPAPRGYALLRYDRSITDLSTVKYLYLLGGRPTYARGMVEHYDEVWRFNIEKRVWKLLLPATHDPAANPRSVPLNRPSNATIIGDVILHGKWYVVATFADLGTVVRCFDLKNHWWTAVVPVDNGPAPEFVATEASCFFLGHTLYMWAREEERDLSRLKASGRGSNGRKDRALPCRIGSSGEGGARSAVVLSVL